MLKMDSKKVMVFAIVLGAIGLLGGAGGYYYQYSEEYTYNEKKIADKTTQRDQLRKMQDEIPVLKQKVEELKLQAKNLQRKLPDQTEVAPEAFLEILQNIAHNINIRQEDPAGAIADILITAAELEEENRRSRGRNTNQTPKQVQKVSYTITLAGGFTNLVLFMNRIETYERYIEVESFKIENTGRQSPMQVSNPDEYTPRYPMTINVTTYTWVGG